MNTICPKCNREEGIEFCGNRNKGGYYVKLFICIPCEQEIEVEYTNDERKDFCGEA